MREQQSRRWVCVTLWLVLTVPGFVSARAQAVMNEPDDSKPVQLSGCMTARTKGGGFVLSNVFGRPVTVIGPNYLQVGLGHQVTLTGNWQTNGIAPESRQTDATRMFVATSVNVTAKQCAKPPSGDPNDKSPDTSKQQR